MRKTCDSGVSAKVVSVPQNLVPLPTVACLPCFRTSVRGTIVPPSNSQVTTTPSGPDFPQPRPHIHHDTPGCLSAAHLTI